MTMQPNPTKVYPRVGGATLPEWHNLGRHLGLSPRGRGNLRWLRQQTLARRSIPAWAGQPSRSNSAYSSSRVYPRVGGATVFTQYRPLPVHGLSPRGRGNRMQVNHLCNRPWSIPAWAGQPQ